MASGSCWAPLALKYFWPNSRARWREETSAPNMVREAAAGAETSATLGAAGPLAWATEAIRRVEIRVAAKVNLRPWVVNMRISFEPKACQTILALRPAPCPACLSLGQGVASEPANQWEDSDSILEIGGSHCLPKRGRMLTDHKPNAPESIRGVGVTM